MADIVTTTLSGVPALWTKRVPFDCNGTLRAVKIDSEYQIKTLLIQWENHQDDPESITSPFGQLPDVWGAELVEALVNDGPIYVVYSYETPIAWVDRDDVETVPSVKYSATTSKHLGKLYKV